MMHPLKKAFLLARPQWRTDRDCVEVLPSRLRQLVNGTREASDSGPTEQQLPKWRPGSSVYELDSVLDGGATAVTPRKAAKPPKPSRLAQLIAARAQQ
jgi:hypothetical protein